MKLKIKWFKSGSRLNNLGQAIVSGALQETQSAFNLTSFCNSTKFSWNSISPLGGNLKRNNKHPDFLFFFFSLTAFENSAGSSTETEPQQLCWGFGQCWDGAAASRKLLLSCSTRCRLGLPAWCLQQLSRLFRMDWVRSYSAGLNSSVHAGVGTKMGKIKANMKLYSLWNYAILYGQLWRFLGESPRDTRGVGHLFLSVGSSSHGFVWLPVPP